MAIEQTIVPKEDTSNFTAVKIIGLIADTHIPSKQVAFRREFSKHSKKQIS